MDTKLLRVVASVPIKKNSERVPRKNFCHYDGEPLYQRTLKTLFSVVHIDKIIVDTDSEEIMDWCEAWESDHPPNPHRPVRPQFVVLKRDTDKIKPWNNGGYIMAHHRDLMGENYADLWVHTYAIAAGLTAERIEMAINVLKFNPYFDSVFAAREIESKFVWHNGTPLYHIKDFGRTQDWPDMLVKETDSLYVIRDKALKHTRARVGIRPFPMIVDKREDVHIDYPADLPRGAE